MRAQGKYGARGLIGGMLGVKDDVHEGGRRQPLPPSELKVKLELFQLMIMQKLLRSKRARKEGVDDCKRACFVQQPVGQSLEGRRPFGVISPNVPLNTSVTKVIQSETIKRTVERPKISWTLYNSLSVGCDSSVAPWRLHLSKPEPMIESLSKIVKKLEYYRYPYPELPENAHTALAKLATNKSGGLEKLHFKKVVDGWRRALLSLYQGLKVGKVEYFYYLQADLVILFRGKVQQSIEDQTEEFKMKAYIARATKSLVNLLKEEGIPFEGDDYELDDSLPTKDKVFDNNFEGQSSLSEQENVDPRTIKDSINARLNKARKTQSKRRSVAAVTLTITGESAVHLLVDFIMNQRDGRSYVIIPELISPAPFLFGTLCKTELSIVGPILHGDYQVKATGLLLPEAAEEIAGQIYDICSGEQPFSLTTFPDQRTEPFLPFHL